MTGEEPTAIGGEQTLIGGGRKSELAVVPTGGVQKPVVLTGDGQKPKLAIVLTGDGLI